MERESITEQQRAPTMKFEETRQYLKKHETKVIESNENEMRDIIRKRLQEEMKDIKQEILERVNNRVNEMASEILQRVDRISLNKPNDFVNSQIYSNRTKQAGKDVLPTKQFLQRNSLLTDLYKIKHIRTIYNFLLATFIIILLQTAIYDIRHTGSLNLGINTIRGGFGKFPIVLCVWLLMKASALGIYVAFCYWATRRNEYSPQSLTRKIWDYTWLINLIIYELLLLYYPTKAVLDHDLPLGSSMIVLMEQARIAMKTHAFIRSVAPRFLSYKPHSDTSAPKPPGFSEYVYFMFAPTLIYQDSYLRSNKIRWNIVAINFIEVLAIIVMVALLYERMLAPTFQDFGKEPIELGVWMLKTLNTIMPAIFLFLCGWYLLLHSWMNAFAELLRFSDKMFYQDWWTSESYNVYFRSWNIVVHDWLYTYIYKDMYEVLTLRNRVLSACTVYAISSIFHEYIVSISIRFFYPVMLFMFATVGLSSLSMLKPGGNVYFWFTMCLGNGIMFSLYCMEYFARQNCPQVYNDFWDLIIPRTWTCNYK